MNVLATLRFVTRHPLTRERKLAAVGRWVGWQLRSRLARGAISVPFVDDTRLLVRRGMTGATGNVYTGLHEFEDMAFVLHVLRPADLFVDVGANVGSYTVLAAGAVGARCVSIEPVSNTFAALRDNVAHNRLDQRVRPVHAAAGRERRRIVVTTHLDAGNRVAVVPASGGRTEEVDQQPLDALLGGESPTVVKIDVEGYEHEVLAGAGETLRDRSPLAVVMETNQCAREYGRTERGNHESMLDLGYESCGYDPRSRTLDTLRHGYNEEGNTLYVRDLPAVRDRLASARRFRVLGTEI